MADNETFKVKDNDDFMNTLDQTISKIQKVSQVTGTANNRLKEYAKTFDNLNTKMAEYVKLSEGVNSTKTKKGSGKGNFKNIEKVFNSTSQFAKAAKTGNVSAAASSAAKLTTLLGSKMVLASGALGASIATLTKITMDASKQTTEYSRSLKQMGVQLNNLEEKSLDTAGNLNKISNQVSNAFQSLGEVFEPLLNMIVEGTAAIFDVLGADSTEPKKKIYGLENNIVGSARQSGFSLSSSQALAGGTYKAALGLSEEYKQQASDIAAKLAEAWLKGSDAAKEYGVVLNDNVLTGYMASKGIDIANVEITDAMKQYYRYELMLEELSATNQDSMQDMIKDWTKLGITIDKTKGKLFSFDEVIQLSATDNNIPEVLGGLYNIPEKDNNDNLPGLVAPVLPFPGTNPGVLPGTIPGNSILPGGIGNLGDFGLLDILRLLSGLSNKNLKVKVNVPGLELIEELRDHLEYIESLELSPITVNTSVIGIDELNNLNKKIQDILSQSPYVVDLLINTYGYEALNPIYNYLEYLNNTNPHNVDIPISVYGMDGVYELDSGLNSVEGTHKVNVPVSVSNLNQLNTLYNLLLKIRALQGSVGNISTPLSIGSSLVGGSTGNGYSHSSHSMSRSHSSYSTSRNSIGLFGSIGNSIDSFFGFANGGIGTKEVHNATLFENDKKEAIIPLETPAGIQYLSDAMKEAQGGQGSLGGDITINLTLSGVNIADNDAQWELVGKKIAEVIDVQRMRRGELSYGSSF